MKKLFLVSCLVLCLLCFCSCRVADNVAITGDVKNGDTEQNVDVSEKNIQSENEIPENDKKNEDVMTPPEITEFNIEQAIVRLGAVAGNGGEYKKEAERFCSAIVSKDAETFAEFCAGKAEYYDFLDKTEISSFNLLPFEFSEEKLWQLNEEYLYPSAQDNYFVEFDVISSDCPEFDKGKCVYYLGLEMNPVSGSLISVFVPAEKAESKVFSSFDTSFTESFINEFASLYPLQSTLYEGRNYADSFDFANHPHLITHLMARSGACGEPPYIFDEVNEFITSCFDGNEGLDPAALDHALWTSAGRVFQSTDEKRIYGCSWAHGGTSVVFDIAGVEKDGKSAVYAAQIYADYAKIAKAYTLVFHFEEADGELPCLTMVEKRDDTARSVALLSV